MRLAQCLHIVDIQWWLIKCHLLQKASLAHYASIQVILGSSRATWICPSWNPIAPWFSNSSTYQTHLEGRECMSSWEFNRSGVGPENVPFLEAPRWCDGAGLGTTCGELQLLTHTLLYITISGFICILSGMSLELFSARQFISGRFGFLGAGIVCFIFHTS